MRLTTLPSLLRLLLLSCLLLPILRAAIPPTPRDGDFLHDLANVLSPADAATLRQRQAEVFQATRVPIVVVTIPSMGTYASNPYGIEPFARSWFDAWGIGSRQHNAGILLLVSLGDRKARIELGADWGSRWDDHCEWIMDSKLTPSFKAGHFGAGLLEGFEALAEMAAKDPASSPPRSSLGEFIPNSPTVRFLHEGNPVAKRYGPRATLLMLAGGVLLLIGAAFSPDHRAFLIKGGLILIGLALFFWVVTAILALINYGSDRDGSGGDGGFGGGSSGGGGASGGW